MNVTLMNRPYDPDLLCARAAAICTGHTGDPYKALHHALASGHDSVAEHATFTFLIEGISRVTLAQLTRHRIASFTVQSQRYVELERMTAVLPLSIRCNRELSERAYDVLGQSKELYDEALKHGVPKEDARYLIPQAVITQLVLTMNARELRHFFSLRCCNRAQWEIRELADRMLRICKGSAPELFRDAGPGCVRGRCPEKRPCGKPRTHMEVEEE